MGAVAAGIAQPHWGFGMEHHGLDWAGACDAPPPRLGKPELPAGYTYVAQVDI
jgi:hypothetical protein